MPMDRETAQRLRAEIVDFGTRQNRRAMSAPQRAEYAAARRSSRDAMRHLNAVREEAGRLLGGMEHVATNHEIDEQDARAIARAHHIIQEIAAELPV